MAVAQSVRYRMTVDPGHIGRDQIILKFLE